MMIHKLNDKRFRLSFPYTVEYLGGGRTRPEFPAFAAFDQQRTAAEYARYCALTSNDQSGAFVVRDADGVVVFTASEDC